MRDRSRQHERVEAQLRTDAWKAGFPRNGGVGAQHQNSVSGLDYRVMIKIHEFTSFMPLLFVWHIVCILGESAILTQKREIL